MKQKGLVKTKLFPTRKHIEGKTFFTISAIFVIYKAVIGPIFHRILKCIRA